MSRVTHSEPGLPMMDLPKSNLNPQCKVSNRVRHRFKLLECRSVTVTLHTCFAFRPVIAVTDVSTLDGSAEEQPKSTMQSQQSRSTSL